LTGSGNTVTATLIPVVTSTGGVVYKDVTLQFVADAAGNLTLASGFPKVVPSATFITSTFKAGRYYYCVINEVRRKMGNKVVGEANTAQSAYARW
jgi:hypothetical protein